MRSSGLYNRINISIDAGTPVIIIIELSSSWLRNSYREYYFNRRIYYTYVLLTNDEILYPVFIEIHVSQTFERQRVQQQYEQKGYAKRNFYCCSKASLFFFFFFFLIFASIS